MPPENSAFLKLLAAPLLPSKAYVTHSRVKSGGAMRKQWWCASCVAEIDLDNRGRCSACGSDAVDKIERGFSIHAEAVATGVADGPR